MALFYKRPLACACAGFIVAVFATYFLSVFLSFLLALLFILPALAFLLICLFRGFSYRKLFAFLLLTALALGSFRTAADRFGAEDVLQCHQGNGVTMELLIKEVIYQNAYGAEFAVKTLNMQGEKIEELAILRCEAAMPFTVGDRIGGEFVVQNLTYGAYHDGAAQEYFGDGCKFLLIAEDTEALSFLESGTNTLIAKISRARAMAAFRIFNTVGGEEGQLLSAMLLGTKHRLSDATMRDFRLSGVSHLLALSGLHLMILVGIADRILYLLHASKRVRIALVIPFCVFYFVLTGCNYSLLRAMLMLGAVYLSFLLREDNDSITALFLCATAILAVTPYAIFSLSFQMTMLATFGILAFARFHALFFKILPAKKKWQELPVKLLRGILTSILITLTTTLCLLPVLWLTIGAYSLMTPLANLALIAIAPILLFGAMLCLLLPFSAVGTVVGLIAKIVLYLVHFFASFDWMISFSNAYVPFILIPLILASVLLLLLDLKKRYLLTLMPLAAAILAFAIAIPVSHQLGKAQLEVGYRCEGKNEGIVLVQNNKAVLCDVSGSSLTQWRADWYMAQEMGATRLEAFMLTHYHSKSVSAFSRFVQSAYIHELWLPWPQTQDEREIHTQLLEIADRHDVPVTTYNHEYDQKFLEGGTLTVSTPLFYSRSSEPAFCLTVTFADQTLCYHTAALSEYLRGAKKTHACKATHLVLGAHGPVPHDTVEIPQNDTLATVLVGSEQVLSFLEIQQKLRYYVFPSEKAYLLK